MSAAPAAVKRRAGPTTRARAAAAAATGAEAPAGAEAAPGWVRCCWCPPPPLVLPGATSHHRRQQAPPHRCPPAAPAAAPPRRARDASSLLPELPEPLVLHVLSFLPPALLAWAARLVCRAARERFRDTTVVSLRCPDLPLAAVQEAWRGLRSWQQMQLTRARAACGDAAGLDWLRGAGCDMDYVCYVAAEHSQLGVLEWARSEGLDLGDVCHYAARGGQLAVLRWARAQTPPLPWGGLECWEAASRGDVEMLRWLRAQAEPAPWGKSACTRAAAHGQLEALRWLRATGCLWRRGECEGAAAHKGHTAVVAWIREQPAAADDGWSEDEGGEDLNEDEGGEGWSSDEEEEEEEEGHPA
ncbi:hypothetical protein HT031_006133 [Scenedesmus sp. PABB004]|nr:hypothetical protein HT031_006133 [Scenedesmus sp. PABB004]